MPQSTAYRTCPLCEATCGLAVTVEGGAIAQVRGDDDDVFSRGFLCPKGVGIQQLHEDPDRLRAPLVRRDGELVEATWDEAFERVDELLSPLLAEHGRDAVATYVGNPTAHSLGALLYGRVLIKAIGTRNNFSASTVDQMPKHVSAGLMFGHPLSIPVPDVDRTDLLVILGANPLASNGSLLTAPDMRGRLKALKARGGRLVVFDPRRSTTAATADEHHFIRPGSDAFLLMAMVQVVLEDGLVELGALDGHADGLDELPALAEAFTPEAVEPVTGVPADAIRRLARELAHTERAAIYGRMGTTTQEFGTLASWLVDVLNAITGHLDRPGGAMFAKAAAGAPNATGEGGRGRGYAIHRWASRVRELGEANSELPVAVLAEEIETPGEGQIRALVTVAGNPALSTPNSERVGAAIAGLDALVCVDFYVNETTRHADVILPPPSPLEKSHYDIALYQLAVRNVANYSGPVLEPPPGQPAEWEILLRLTGIATGQGPHADVDAIDDFVAAEAVRRELATPGSRIAGREQADVLAAMDPRTGPERLLDLMLRAGPYGDAFGARPDGLSLAVLEANPHGVDLGPLEPRIPEVLRTPDGLAHLAPAPIAADVERLRAGLDRRANGGHVLVGRRHLRSNNSWMHNLPLLVRGPDRCTLHVHPDDAAALGLVDGGLAAVRSAAGVVEAPVEVTEDVMRGVVSLPHGWGHDGAGIRLSVAREHAGVNSNVLTDETMVDPLSGNAVLNGIPVELAPVAAPADTAVPA
jgi:anaerobic selenocysteine-containing dehydrogenase